jgi:plasmid replication initiation protein
MAEITKRLIGRVVQIESQGETGKELLQFAWLNVANYRYGEGDVSLCFSPALKPYLLDIKSRFTKYALQYALHLKSAYAIRLYELLKQYEGIG